MKHTLRNSHCLAVTLAGAIAVAAGCAANPAADADGAHHQDRRIRLADRQGGHLRHLLARGHGAGHRRDQCRGRRAGQAAGADLRGQPQHAGRIRHHRQEADQQRQGRGAAGRGGLGPIVGGGTHRPGRATFRRSRRPPPIRRSRRPATTSSASASSIPFQGKLLADVRAEHAQGEEGRDLLGRGHALQRGSGASTSGRPGWPAAARWSPR